MSGKPVGYPLPWCEVVDAPYWRVNVFLCMFRQGWQEWQGSLSMSQIIPEIDRLFPPTAANQGKDG